MSRCDARVAAPSLRLTRPLTPVEVHLSDENGDKGGEEDTRCPTEGRRPFV
jgi:hypothetical protein